MRSALWLVAALAVSSLLAQMPGPPDPVAEERAKLTICTKDESDCADVAFAKNYEEARMQAGLVAMKGPGVEITLDDSPRSRPTDADPYFYFVHDVDLQVVVNDLWAAGAEAISLNDRRVINRTAITSAGPAILVDGVRIFPPYQVRAIGPADVLTSALSIERGCYGDSPLCPLVQNGGTVTVAKRALVEVPAYAGQAYRYARPVR